MGKPTFVIAECGTNHAARTEQERLGKARQLIEWVAKTGADAVKFQIFAKGELFCPLPGDEVRWKLWERTFLPFTAWREIKEWAERHGLVFLASAFQEETVGWLADLEVRYYKVASRARDNYPYELAPGPFLISTPEPIPKGPARFHLACTPEYPCPLRAYDGRFDGLSDHSGTVFPGLYAIAQGAGFLEVHVPKTGRDREAAIELTELKLLCQARDAFHVMRAAAA